jgi:hypothetical protein
MNLKSIPANSHITLMGRPFGAPRFHFDENAGGGAAGGAGDAGAGGGQQTAWHTGIDAEFIGHAQNKGWKLDDPKEAFIAATKQARELERHFGVPPDRLIKLPGADAKPEEMRAIYERLGAPKEAKEYDLSAVKDESLAETLRASIHGAGLSKDAASAIAKAVGTALESKATAQSTVDAQKLADEKTALAANWKDKFEFNRLQAMEGARRLGISPEGVKALENQIGYAAVMEAMRKIGANTREDTFVERGLNNTGEVTTREGAVARKSELMADKVWVDKYLKGEASAVREMTRLNSMIEGEA